MYNNPIINRDYSDPDVIRVNNDYYMVASSFNFTPGVPILHSTDLIHWDIINYALKKLPDEYDKVKPGCGVWAPSIRYHNNEFFIFIPFPDEGIFVARSKDILGEFCFYQLNSTKGLIDPCPIWLEDKAYVFCAFAKSRIGFNSKICVFEMDMDAQKSKSSYEIIFDGTNTAPTIEGPKIYHINDYYYILAPAGGVKTGWQMALRSKNIKGPYEEKIVMIQGDTNINGPHQGGLIQDQNNKYWFLHFQDRNIYGRVLLLEPVQFIDDWPIIGRIKGNVGEPYNSYNKPNLKPSKNHIYHSNFNKIDLYWQSPANNYYYYLEEGLNLRGCNNKIEELPNTFLQMVEYEKFVAKMKMISYGGFGGMIVAGNTCNVIGIKDKTIYVNDEEFGKVDTQIIYFKLVCIEGTVTFFYSIDDKKYIKTKKIIATPGNWVGCKIGIFLQGEDTDKTITKYFKIQKKS